MAVANIIQFGAVSSDAYDVLIEGPGEYTAAKRDYESISIPGRNGAFILDKGRFENIEGEFKVVVYGETQLEFQQKIADFRNAIVSQRGYQRLTETYHPNEYRMAAYKGGLDEDPEFIGKAAVFKIIFDCKPQRYLTSGEEAITVLDGETITNPTLFEAQPMLEVEGYGNIGIGDSLITVDDGELGEIQISDSLPTASVTLNVDNLNTGDSIINKSTTQPYVDILLTAPSTISYYGASMQDTYDKEHGSVITTKISANSFRIRIMPKIESFVNGTDSSMTIRCIAYIQIGSTSYSSLIDTTVSYTASTNTVELSTAFFSGPNPSGTTVSYQYMHPAYYGISTKVILPSLMYIDLDIGEAYGLVDGEITAFNNIVYLPATLPTLKPGANMISFDDTVSELKIVPRWWKI